MMNATQHPASNNWGNVRKDADKGIRTGEPSANYNAVKVLLSGSENESLGFVRRHAGNQAWLKLAAQIEGVKVKPRVAVTSFIAQLLRKMQGRAA